jgi:hypothetical protein
MIEFLVYFLNQINIPQTIEQIKFSIEVFKMLTGKG